MAKGFSQEVYIPSIGLTICLHLIVAHEPCQVAIEGTGKPEEGEEGGDHVDQQQSKGQKQDIPGFNVLRMCSELNEPEGLTIILEAIVLRGVVKDREIGSHVELGGNTGALVHHRVDIAVDVSIILRMREYSWLHIKDILRGF